MSCTTSFRRLKLLFSIFFLLSIFSNTAIGLPKAHHSHHLAERIHLDSTQLIASGNWSDSSIWQQQNPPKDGDTLVVPKGITLVVDGLVTARIKKIIVEGTLKFATDRNTQLNVGTLISKKGSVLQIGSKTRPVDAKYNAKIMFADFGPITAKTDPTQLSGGAMLMGKVEVHGAEKTTWTALAYGVKAGESTIALDIIPKGWKTSDRLVIAATDFQDPLTDEVVNIASIQGNQVHLSTKLRKDHWPLNKNLKVHVANLSRNIEFFSQNPAIKHRGHVMFMHNLDVNINFARFYQLGRTDKSIPVDDWHFPQLDDVPPVKLAGNNIRGRYSIHFHRGGTDIRAKAAQVKSCVVEDDPGWAYVNHSSNVAFIDNISYKVTGGAFQTEAGDELGSFINNIALRTVNMNFPLLDKNKAAPDFREQRQDYAFQGDGFWIHGGGVKVEGNVVSGASGHAFIYWPEGLVEPKLGSMMFKARNLPNSNLPSSVKKIDIWHVPVTSFKKNTAYAATKGLSIYYLHASYLGQSSNVPASYVDNLRSYFDSFTAWNIRKIGLEFNFAENLILKNFKLYGNGKPDVIGVDANHFHNMGTYLFENFHIEGFAVGMDVPTQGNININKGMFSNRIDFRILNPQTQARNLAFNDIKFGAAPYNLEEDRFWFEMAPDFTYFGETQNDLQVKDGDKHILFFLMPDRIQLNFGQFRNHSLYYKEQHADFVPMTTKNSQVAEEYMTPHQYVNKSNRELYRKFELRFSSGLMSSDARTSSKVRNGLIGSKSKAPIVEPDEP